MKTNPNFKIVWFVVFLFYSGSLIGQRLLVCDTKEGYWIYEDDSTLFYFALGGPITDFNDVDLELFFSGKNSLYFQLFEIQKYANEKVLKTINALNEEEKITTEAKILLSFFKKEGLYGCPSFNVKRAPSQQKLWILQQGKPERNNQSSVKESNEIVAVVGACSVFQKHILRIITMQYPDQDFESVNAFLLSVTDSYTKINNAEEFNNLCRR